MGLALVALFRIYKMMKMNGQQHHSRKRDFREGKKDDKKILL